VEGEGGGGREKWGGSYGREGGWLEDREGGEGVGGEW